MVHRSPTLQNSSWMDGIALAGKGQSSKTSSLHRITRLVQHVFIAISEQSFWKSGRGTSLRSSCVHSWHLIITRKIKNWPQVDGIPCPQNLGSYTLPDLIFKKFQNFAQHLLHQNMSFLEVWEGNFAPHPSIHPSIHPWQWSNKSLSSAMYGRYPAFTQ
jgi:hypothetical protein